MMKTNRHIQIMILILFTSLLPLGCGSDIGPDPYAKGGGLFTTLEGERALEEGDPLVAWLWGSFDKIKVEVDFEWGPSPAGRDLELDIILAVLTSGRVSKKLTETAALFLRNIVTCVDTGEVMSETDIDLSSFNALAGQDELGFIRQYNLSNPVFAYTTPQPDVVEMDISRICRLAQLDIALIGIDDDSSDKTVYAREQKLVELVFSPCNR